MYELRIYSRASAKRRRLMCNHPFLKDPVNIEITEYDVIFSRPTISSNKKIYNFHLNLGLYETTINCDLDPGTLMFDEDESDEDRIVFCIE